MSARLATVVLLAFLAVLAGCGNGGTSTPVEAAGSTALDSTIAVDPAGYEHQRTTNRTLNATVSVSVEGDIEAKEYQDVTATVPVAVYRRSTADGPAMVAVAASPSVQVIENPSMSADPLATLSTAELVAFVRSTDDELTDLRETDTTNVRLLGEETDLVTYEGRDGDGGERVVVHVARAEHDDDVVPVVAFHPASVEERQRVTTLVEGVAH